MTHKPKSTKQFKFNTGNQTMFLSPAYNTKAELVTAIIQSVPQRFEVLHHASGVRGVYLAVKDKEQQKDVRYIFTYPTFIKNKQYHFADRDLDWQGASRAVISEFICKDNSVWQNIVKQVHQSLKQIKLQDPKFYAEHCQNYKPTADLQLVHFDFDKWQIFKDKPVLQGIYDSLHFSVWNDYCQIVKWFIKNEIDNKKRTVKRHAKQNKENLPFVEYFEWLEQFKQSRIDMLNLKVADGVLDPSEVQNELDNWLSKVPPPPAGYQEWLVSQQAK